jgi:hypothetical protein
MARITETYENGITRTYETETCAKCQSENDPLAMFPRNLCLPCYSQTAEANRPITADSLTAMWTSPNLINL